jgi:hypothetical protein
MVAEARAGVLEPDRRLRCPAELENAGRQERESLVFMVVLVGCDRMKSAPTPSIFSRRRRHNRA